MKKSSTTQAHHGSTQGHHGKSTFGHHHHPSGVSSETELDAQYAQVSYRYKTIIYECN